MNDQGRRILAPTKHFISEHFKYIQYFLSFPRRFLPLVLIMYRKCDRLYLSFISDLISSLNWKVITVLFLSILGGFLESMKVFRISNVIYFLLPRRFFRYQVFKMYRFVKIISISNIVLLLYNIQCAQIKFSFLKHTNSQLECVLCHNNKD